MKSFILHILICVCFVQSSAAQNKGGAAAAAAAGAVAIGALALEIHAMLERLESEAFNYMAENHPEYEAFRLKVLDLDGKKISDIGAMSVVTFKLTKLDRKTGLEGERSVLMMLTSDGWITEYGINLSLVSWSLFSRADWNDMFGSFIDMNTPLELDTSTFLFNKVKALRRREFDAQDSLHFQLGGKYYMIDPLVTISALTLSFGRRGMSEETVNQYGDVFYNLVLPFYPLRNDDYIVRDFSEKFKLFANERSMGLYVKAVKRSMQLSRSTVGEIHSFVNTVRKEAW